MAPAPEMEPEMETERSDVVVVGAGFSGLAATRTLLASGVQTVLLEARDRVGGRCENAALPGGDDGWTLDLGAGWTGSGQHRLHSLASEFGVELVEPHQAGDSIAVLGGGGSTSETSTSASCTRSTTTSQPSRRRSPTIVPGTPPTRVRSTPPRSVRGSTHGASATS